jgi:hypothetical protein
MSDQAFTIQPRDIPGKPNEDGPCSRCRKEEPIKARARWNEVEFRYCEKCAEGK